MCPRNALRPYGFVNAITMHHNSGKVTRLSISGVEAFIMDKV